MAASKGKRRGSGEGAVYHRADGRWEAKVDVSSGSAGRHRKSIYGATRAEVVAKLRGVQRAAEIGVVTDERLTVGQWLDKWLQESLPGRVSPSTLDNYTVIAEKHLKPIIGTIRLSKLTPDDVQQLLRSKETEIRRHGDAETPPLVGYSVNTIRRIRAVLVQAIKHAQRWGIVVRNVAALTDGPKMVKAEGRSLSSGEAKTLLKAAKSRRLEAAYVLMLTLGLRRGELLALSWTDVDFDRRQITIRQALPSARKGEGLVLRQPKAGSRRTLMLPEQVVTILKAHRRRQATERLKAGATWVDGGYVFTTELGGLIDPRNFHRSMSTLAKDCGLGHWHPHELRHSAASIMLAQGVPLEVVSEVLGHASIRMTKDVYGHLIGSQKRDAADAMDAALWGSG